MKIVIEIIDWVAIDTHHTHCPDIYSRFYYSKLVDNALDFLMGRNAFSTYSKKDIIP